MAFSLGRITTQGAIPNVGDIIAVANALAPAAQALVSAGTTDTISPTQLLSGLFVRSGVAVAVTATTDTATNIINAMPNPYVGQTFLLFYANLNSGTGVVTVVGGVGVTTAGTLTIPIAGLRVFQGTVTNVATPTVFLNSLFSIGSGVAA